MYTVLVISTSRNGLLKAYPKFIIERSEIRKKQHAFKSVHFECRMVLFYIIWEKSRLFFIMKKLCQLNGFDIEVKALKATHVPTKFNFKPI